MENSLSIADWDMDGIPITDQDFNDLVHYEEI